MLSVLRYNSILMIRNNLTLIFALSLITVSAFALINSENSNKVSEINISNLKTHQDTIDTKKLLVSIEEIQKSTPENDAAAKAILDQAKSIKKDYDSVFHMINCTTIECQSKIELPETSMNTQINHLEQIKKIIPN
jgi:hypothetical protein